MATAPPPEPISLAQAKAHLRVLDNSEDARIAGIIVGAREFVENCTGKILVRRSITEHRPRFGDVIHLEHRPVVSITGINYTGADGVTATLPAGSFFVTEGARVRIYPAASWPATHRYGYVSITYVAGYLPAEVPQSLMEAMYLLIGHWFDNREGVVVGTIASEVPFAVDALCRQHRAPVV